MSDGDREWRWVGEDGVQITGTEQELSSGLSAETVPFYTLVWRPGWLEWLPAMQVAELSGAMPKGRADNPVKPRERENALKPPPPPVYRYSVIKRRAQTLMGTASAARSSGGGFGATLVAGTPSQAGAGKVPGATSSRTLMAGTPLDAASSSAAQPVAEAEPGAPSPKAEPDGVEDVELAAIEASRPHNAFSVDDIELDKDEFGPPPEPVAASPSPEAVYVPPHAPRTSERPLPQFDDVVPPFPAAKSPPADLHEYASRAAKSEQRTRRRSLVYPVGGAVAVVAILAGGLLLRRGRSEPGPAPSAAASSSAESGPSRVPCRITAAAAKVAEHADPSVQPLFANVDGTSRVAVGYAESDTTAIGMTIDPKTLDRDQVFREKKKQKLVSVVPASPSKLRFEVSRDGGSWATGRALEASPPFAIAGGAAGILRIDPEGHAEVVFPVAGPELTLPRVASAPAGHAVTARSGGKAGKILVGFLDGSGQKKGELFPVPGAGDFVGMPAIAARDDGALVAFAARGSNDPGWGIAVSRVKWGLAPSPASRVTVPPGGPGGEAISPSITALADGRWLLTWTEGPSGNRVVRAEALAEDLSPASAPLTLSPEGSNAGQAALWTTGSGVLALFYVLAGGSQELWATALDCSP